MLCFICSPISGNTLYVLESPYIFNMISLSFKGTIMLSIDVDIQLSAHPLRTGIASSIVSLHVEYITNAFLPIL